MKAEETQLHVATAEAFYKAFAVKDADAMGRMYADQATFSDPVFPDLRGENIRQMWRMLCKRSKDLTIEHKVVYASAERVDVQWTARYTFAKTGRPVENRILAKMTIRDGLIIHHHDVFNFWRWARQALGPAGVLLGWSPLVRNAVRRQAAEALKAWSQAAGESSSR